MMPRATWVVNPAKDDPSTLAAFFASHPDVGIHTVVELNVMKVGTMAKHFVGTSAQYVARHRQPKTLASLLAKNYFTLHSCATSGWIEGVAILLRGGVDIDAENEHAHTALEHLCFHYYNDASSIEMKRYLVWRGATRGRFHETEVSMLFMRRDRCRASVIALLAARRHGSISVFGGNDVYVIRAIASVLWAMRLSAAWSYPRWV